jgi:hypothetical protein
MTAQIGKPVRATALRDLVQAHGARLVQNK